VLRLSFCGSEMPVGQRQASEYEFASRCDRECFCAHVHSACERAVVEVEVAAARSGAPSPTPSPAPFVAEHAHAHAHAHASSAAEGAAAAEREAEEPQSLVESLTESLAERRPSRSSTARACAAPGCAQIHRYPDGFCHLHRREGSHDKKAAAKAAGKPPPPPPPPPRAATPPPPPPLPAHLLAPPPPPAKASGWVDVFAGTFNVGECPAPADPLALLPWLCPGGSSALKELYLISLQECEHGPQVSAVREKERERESR
jgi:hypothetical protein